MPDLLPEIVSESADWILPAGADFVGGMRVERRRSSPNPGWYVVTLKGTATGPFPSAWGARAWMTGQRRRHRR